MKFCKFLGVKKNKYKKVRVILERFLLAAIMATEVYSARQFKKWLQHELTNK